MALNIDKNWDGPSLPDWMLGHRDQLRKAREQGWDIHAIEEMDGLVAFARSFSQRHYSAKR